MKKSIFILIYNEKNKFKDILKIILKYIYMHKSISNLISSNLYSILTGGNEKTNYHDNILEPISTVIKLAVISFLPIGTKISIKDNNIHVQNPSFLQGVFRWSNGDKFSDMHNLIHPLKKFMDLRETSIIFNDNKSDLFISLAVKGLQKLKKTYAENSIVIQTFELYEDILTGVKIRRNSMGSETSSETERTTFDIYEKFNALWVVEEIEIVHNILSHLNKSYHEQEEGETISNPYLASLVVILDKKEKETTNILLNVHKIT